MYLTFKFLHLIGVIILVGNVTATAVWKAFANRTGDAAIVSFAQRLVTYTDWSLTLSGILLVTLGGYGMVIAGGLDPRVGWLLWGQILFAVSGTVWAVILLPLQIRQARLANSFSVQKKIPDVYWVMSKQWMFWGIVATIPLVAATFVMIIKF